MQVGKQLNLPKPPGLIASLTAGFDAVAGHVSLILLPLALDLILWLGPHLRIRSLMQPVIDQMAATSLPLVQGVPDVASLQKVWTDFLNQFNLLALLRTFPVGLTSLMAASKPVLSPLGLPFDLEVGSFSGLILVWLLMALAGWLLGGVFYRRVALVSLALEQKPAVASSLRQSMVLSLIWAVSAALLMIPALLTLTILALIHPALAQLAMFVVLMLAVWVLAPVYFSPHGVFAFGQNAPAAIMQSLRMMRFSLPGSGLFLVVCLLINEGLNYLWRLPPADSWLTLVGIGGHAFISTALLAASFIYYRNTNAWLKTVFEAIQAQRTPAENNQVLP